MPYLLSVKIILLDSDEFILMLLMDTLLFWLRPHNGSCSWLVGHSGTFWDPEEGL